MPRLAITTATGPADATRASIPFHIAANGASSVGVSSAVILSGDATEILKPGVLDSLQGVGVPRLSELMAKCLSTGVEIHV